MEEEMITHRGERETESDVKGGEMQICMFHWMVKEKKEMAGQLSSPFRLLLIHVPVSIFATNFSRKCANFCH